MEQQKFRATITIEFEDLVREGGKDRGNRAVLVNNEVSAQGRQLMEASLMDTLKGWGDNYLERKKPGEQSEKPKARPGR